MRSAVQVFILLIGTSLVAMAHSEEVLFIPFGQLAGLAAALVLAIVLQRHWVRVLVTLFMGTAGAVLTWFAPLAVQHAWNTAVGKGPFSYFVLGFVPVLIFAYAGFRFGRRGKKPDQALDKI